MPYVSKGSNTTKQAGCHSATQILNEIRQLGFKGSRSIMMGWVSETLRPPRSAHSHSQSEKVVPWSASRASWLLIRDEDELEDDDKQALERMKQVDGKVAEAHVLGQRFVQMVRERQSEALLPWLEDATKSRIEVLKQFAKGIKQIILTFQNIVEKSYCCCR
jgi:transposase